MSNNSSFNNLEDYVNRFDYLQRQSSINKIFESLMGAPQASQPSLGSLTAFQSSGSLSAAFQSSGSLSAAFQSSGSLSAAPHSTSSSSLSAFLSGGHSSSSSSLSAALQSTSSSSLSDVLANQRTATSNNIVQDDNNVQSTTTTTTTSSTQPCEQFTIAVPEQTQWDVASSAADTVYGLGITTQQQQQQQYQQQYQQQQQQYQQHQWNQTMSEDAITDDAYTTGDFSSDDDDDDDDDDDSILESDNVMTDDQPSNLSMSTPNLPSYLHPQMMEYHHQQTQQLNHQHHQYNFNNNNVTTQPTFSFSNSNFNSFSQQQQPSQLQQSSPQQSSQQSQPNIQVSNQSINSSSESTSLNLVSSPLFGSGSFLSRPLPPPLFVGSTTTTMPTSMTSMTSPSPMMYAPTQIFSSPSIPIQQTTTTTTTTSPKSVAASLNTGAGRMDQSPYKRSDKSLKKICDMLLDVFANSTDPKINLESLTARLQVNKRRFYEILNVMECLGVVAKEERDCYHWKGLQNITTSLYSIFAMSILFIRLFLVREQVSIQDAKDTYNLTSMPAKCKRLYDIANILDSLGIIKKVPKVGTKQYYVWAAPIQMVGDFTDK
ncbi:hypothetical protein SAMD00019534_069060 [Acytostelium subglobosum LB1]|uniref:hypothetical protein n=1 Tax=Acytostelium subglobosum LB1 TaxID=1410327 RepID=UPI000644DBBE|nr:hypothetical protein SAMD00019534_069060 [Acytostelium subglobosum LB1]GAM23731.1 hypothetical protein SAMD00019534_069060 [Acytostelium subglobosum LB1]|eukprot:XP_012753472.1 hypothetical protein SAMD00019534_069060 [Acytostelium subglobosum LB1]